MTPSYALQTMNTPKQQKRDVVAARALNYMLFFAKQFSIQEVKFSASRLGRRGISRRKAKNARLILASQSQILPGIITRLCHLAGVPEGSSQGKFTVVIDGSVNEVEFGLRRSTYGPLPSLHIKKLVDSRNRE